VLFWVETPIGILPGQYFDEQTGLHYNWQRYFNPETGRYVSVDPIGFWAGDPNLHRYTGNNPINLMDPFGLKVCAPGLLESLIPVWGLGKAAINDFQNGKWGAGVFDTAMAVSDVFLVKAAVTGLSKGAWKVGSNTWSATSKWLNKTGRREFKGQEIHHWLIPQREWGEQVPDFIKNQPWNLMSMPKDPTFHQGLHGKGINPMNLAEKLWNGTPTWFKAATTSTAGRIPNMGGGNGDCDCD
jgi:RHS repeat-associated protein